MKKILTLLTALTLTYAGFAQTYYNWSFASSSSFPAGFVTWNLDSQTISPNLVNAISAFSSNNGWVIDNQDFQSNVALSASYFTNSAVAADRWLVTAKMNVPTGVPNVGLVWTAVSLGPILGASDLDNYEVRISTTDSSASSFTTTLLTVNAESGNGATHVLPLSAYAGQTVRIAFRENTTNGIGLLMTSVKLINLPSDAAKISDVEVYEHNWLGQAANISGTLNNTGLDTINSFTLNYSINGGAPVTSPVTNAGYLPQQSFFYNHPTPFNPSTAGTYTIAVWMSGLNGSSANSDTVSTTTFFYPQVAGLQKNVLVEEFTGAWCGWCPGGALAMHDLLESQPYAIGVSIHDQNGGGASADAMQVTEGKTVSNTFNSGFPSAMADRLYFFDNQSISLGFGFYNTVPDVQNIDTASTFRYHQATPVNVSLANKTYDSTDGSLSIDVNATFLNSLSQGDYRLNLYLVEDSVITTGNGYNQHNYYSTAGANQDPGNSPLNALPATITNNGLVGGWAQNHVLRAMEGGAWGTASIIPSAPVAGQTYTTTYTATLPSTWRNQFVKVIGVVQEYNTDVNKRTILNATEARLLDINTGIKQVSSLNKLSVYPNPASTMATVEMDLKENATVSISVVNTLGETVVEPNDVLLNTGTHSVKVPVSNLADGLYFVKVSVNGQTNSTPLSIVK